MHVRLSQVAGDPQAVSDALRYIEYVVRPAVETQPGSMGLALNVGAQPGVMLVESFWATAEALHASERAVAPGRGEAALLGGQTVTVERYQLPVFEQDVPGGGGEGVRLARMDAEPSAVDDVIEVYGDTFVPWLAETPGFHGALLCADRASGRLISQDIWHDRPALDAAATVVAAARTAVARSAPCTIRSVQEHLQVFSSARKPRS
jgi:hypothetical protein